MANENDPDIVITTAARTEGIDKIDQRFGEMVANVKSKAAEIGAAVQNGIDPASAEFQQLVDEGEAAAQALRELGEEGEAAFDKLVESAEQEVEALAEVEEAAHQATEAVAESGSTASAQVPNIGSLRDVIKQTGGSAGELGLKVISVYAAFKEGYKIGEDARKGLDAVAKELLGVDNATFKLAERTPTVIAFRAALEKLYKVDAGTVADDTERARIALEKYLAARAKFKQLEQPDIQGTVPKRDPTKDAFEGEEVEDPKKKADETAAAADTKAAAEKKAAESSNESAEAAGRAASANRDLAKSHRETAEAAHVQVEKEAKVAEALVVVVGKMGEARAALEAARGKGLSGGEVDSRELDSLRKRKAALEEQQAAGGLSLEQSEELARVAAELSAAETDVFAALRQRNEATGEATTAERELTDAEVDRIDRLRGGLLPTILDVVAATREAKEASIEQHGAATLVTDATEEEEERERQLAETLKAGVDAAKANTAAQQEAAAAREKNAGAIAGLAAGQATFNASVAEGAAATTDAAAATEQAAAGVDKLTESYAELQKRDPVAAAEKLAAALEKVKTASDAIAVSIRSWSAPDALPEALRLIEACDRALNKEDAA